MLQFSTDDLRPQDRFAYWCEARGKNLFGVTIELEKEQRSNFWGRFSASAISGNAVLAEMSASAYRVSRLPSDVARIQGDSLVIGLQVSGPGWLDVGRDRVHLIRKGALTVGYSDLNYVGIPDHGGIFEYRMLKIPVAGHSFGISVNNLVAEPLAMNGRLTRLIEATFHSLSAPQAQADGTSAADVEHIARLALMARGRLSLGAPGARDALRAGYLHAARAVLSENLHRPELSPTKVAAALGISVRQLHHLFEPTGTTFARTLTLKRLDAAHRILVTEPHRPVIDVAYACGFDSAATFYRAFRVVFGITPTDARARAVES